MSRISEKVDEENTPRDEIDKGDWGNQSGSKRSLLEDKSLRTNMPPIEKAQRKLEHKELDEEFQKIIDESIHSLSPVFPSFDLDKNVDAPEPSPLAKAKSFIVDKTKMMSLRSLTPAPPQDSKTLTKEEAKNIYKK